MGLSISPSLSKPGACDGYTGAGARFAAMHQGLIERRAVIAHQTPSEPPETPPTVPPPRPPGPEIEPPDVNDPPSPGQNPVPVREPPVMPTPVMTPPPTIH